VFTAEKRKHDRRQSKVPKLTIHQEHMYQTANTGNMCMQFKHQLNAEDHHLILELEDYLMQGKLLLTTPTHIFVASPVIQKDIVEKLRLQWMENTEQEVTQGTNGNKVQT